MLSLCESSIPAMRDEAGQVTELITGEGEDLVHQQRLTHLLELAQPSLMQRP